jgi:ATP-dependent DNA ligase
MARRSLSMKNGLSVFDLIHYQRRDQAVTLCAFDLLELDGKDLRRAPIEERKRILAKLSHKSHPGIALNQHYEGDGATIYSMPARSAVRASYRSGWARRIAPAASITGLK